MTEDEAKTIVEAHKHLREVINDQRLQSPIDRDVYSYLTAQGFLAGLEAGRKGRCPHPAYSCADLITVLEEALEAKRGQLKELVKAASAFRYGGHGGETETEIHGESKCRACVLEQALDKCWPVGK